ncbi:uncharacterized protein F13E9.13, mitochondrial isoform X2 [Topomyia yanbarensis]|uniref:uncharacterized protein F13E9.13, mitochondrial isoform X2 n=1 Tax=Topomyia yanbarensis TaxID=2498891 RepID=UPI00273C6C5F|nr:uncharacterized protein F13E9.13, mitochondrial isoform X2 [Topomyia yanbarensis]
MLFQVDSTQTRGNFDDAIKKAICEATIYLQSGIDGVIIENMHDVPYVKSRYFTPETVSCMSRLALAVKETIRNAIPCGIQILACGNMEALAVSKACNLNFIRAEGFVFSHVADEGFTDATAGHILRYRKIIDAEPIGVITDIKKKHSSHAITSDVSVLDTARAAEFFCSDGIVLTGEATGCETNVEEVQSLKKVNLPLIIGSGVTLENVDNYWNTAHAAVIGSYFKHDGNWKNDLCEARVRLMMKKIDVFRNQLQ